MTNPFQIHSATVVFKSPDLGGRGGEGRSAKCSSNCSSLALSHVSLDPRRLTLQARRSDPVLAVFKRTTLGLTAREVTEHLHVSASSQKLWLSTFEKTGDVFQKRGAQGRPRALSKDERFDLVMRVYLTPRRQHSTDNTPLSTSPRARG